MQKPSELIRHITQINKKSRWNGHFFVLFLSSFFIGKFIEKHYLQLENHLMRLRISKQKFVKLWIILHLEKLSYLILWFEVTV